MKLIIKDEDRLKEKRISIVEKEKPCLDSEWHYHAQYELLYITKSFGIRFVGDDVSQFNPRDLVLVGPYLPHLWRNDISYYDSDKNNILVKTIVTKFSKDFIGENTFDNPEFQKISNLLNDSNFGVCFGKKIEAELRNQIIELPNLPRPKQGIQLLNILYQLSESKDRTILSSSDMRQYTSGHSHRLDEILKFISDNYSQKITLKDVADIACMTTNSFCRFFKKGTNKSFTQFLNEVRIKNASRLLMQENISVSSVCYTVGYNSIANFNRQFKLIMSITPSEFKNSIHFS